MLPILTAIKTAKLFGLDVLTIVKFGCIILLMLLSSWITYNVAENKYNKERLELSRAELVQEKTNTAYWLSQINIAHEQSKQAILTTNLLTDKIDKLTKGHNNAPALPPTCVLDDDGMQYMQAARDEAISSATRGQSNN